MDRYHDRSFEHTLPARIRTAELYMPERRRPEEMTIAQLRRGMCPKSGGDWHVCQRCLGGCGVGQQMVDYMTGKATPPAEELPKAPPPITKPAPPPTDHRGKYSPAKQKEIAKDALRRAKAGESYKSIAASYNYSPDGLKRVMRRAGVIPPQQLGGSEQCRARAKQRALSKYLAALDAIARGEDKQAAAKAAGYANYKVLQSYGYRHKEAIANALAERARSQAVAD